MLGGWEADLGGHDKRVTHMSNGADCSCLTTQRLLTSCEAWSDDPGYPGVPSFVCQQLFTSVENAAHRQESSSLSLLLAGPQQKAICMVSETFSNIWPPCRHEVILVVRSAAHLATMQPRYNRTGGNLLTTTLCFVQHKRTSTALLSAQCNTSCILRRALHCQGIVQTRIQAAPNADTATCLHHTSQAAYRLGYSLGVVP